MLLLDDLLGLGIVVLGRLGLLTNSSLVHLLLHDSLRGHLLLGSNIQRNFGLSLSLKVLIEDTEFADGLRSLITLTADIDVDLAGCGAFLTSL